MCEEDGSRGLLLLHGLLLPAHHVVAVNCDLRLVFCNTLGALPFTLAKEPGKWMQNESDETHDNVAARFRIARVTRVWRILRA